MDKIRHLLIRLLSSEKDHSSNSIMQQTLELQDLARKIRKMDPADQNDDNIPNLLQEIKFLLQPLTNDQCDKRQDSDDDSRRKLKIQGDWPKQSASGNDETQPDEHSSAAVRLSENVVEPSDLALEIIRLRDWTLVSKDGGGNEETKKMLEAIYVMLGQALTMENITEYSTCEGAFDPVMQQAVMSAPAPEPTKKNQIHTSIRPGYMFMGKILRQQQVSIFV